MAETPSTSTPICFGDVIQLVTKSVHAEGEVCPIAFLEQRNQMVLVVPPVRPELTAKLMSAEFIISPVRGSRQPAMGAPVHYTQPFVLRTSDGNGYSLNNKTPGSNDYVSLQLTNTKGEMYMSIEKEGYTIETAVHDGDMNLELNVVDSNRIRKTYNKPLGHSYRPRTDMPGGFVSCSSKAMRLSFKLNKLMDRTTTRAFLKAPVMRRASMEALDAIKLDELKQNGFAGEEDESEVESSRSSRASNSLTASNPRMSRTYVQLLETAAAVQDPTMLVPPTTTTDVSSTTAITTSSDSNNTDSSNTSTSATPASSVSRTDTRALLPVAASRTDTVPSMAPVVTPPATASRTNTVGALPVVVPSSRTNTSSTMAVTPSVNPTTANSKEMEVSRTETVSELTTISIETTESDVKTTNASSVVVELPPVCVTENNAIVVVPTSSSSTTMVNSESSIKTLAVARTVGHDDDENLQTACAGGKCTVM